MKHHQSSARLGTVLLLSLSLGLTACSLPNATVTKGAAAVSKPLSNGEILQVLQTLNSGELKQAELVFKRPTLAEVQKTAQLIVKDHTASNQRIAAITKDGGIKLEESPLSRGLQAQMNQITEGMTKLSDTEFECTYLKKQVEQHALALDTVRKQLLPAAENPQVKELLTTAAPALEAHRQAAQKSYDSISECPRS